MPPTDSDDMRAHSRSRCASDTMDERDSRKGSGRRSTVNRAISVGGTSALDEGGHDVLLRRFHRSVRGREMRAGINVRILRGQKVEQRHPVILPLRGTGSGNRAAKILLRQALIAVARIFPRQAMPVIVAALNGELLGSSLVIVIARAMAADVIIASAAPIISIRILFSFFFCRSGRKLRRHAATGQSHLV